MIAIIGVLSAVVLANFPAQAEKSKVSVALADIRELKSAILRYRIDTNRDAPPGYCDQSCSSTTDPFMNSLGVPGWSGPYYRMYDHAHPWGGQFGIVIDSDFDHDGTTEMYIVLNDDRPGTLIDDDDKGQVPQSAMKTIDRILDDGVLSTGKVLGNISALGELLVMVK